jgi:glycosyltransferase involved in cell wall biosynthesis
VVGDAALTAPAGDESRLAEHCSNILRDEALAGDLRRRGERRVAEFTMESMGRALAEVYREVMTKR